VNIEQIMQQAQQFQQKLAEIQQQLASRQVTSTVGGSMVSATVNGSQQLVAIAIDKEVIDPEERGMLEDLVVAAVNDALEKARGMARAEMAGLTGGLNIPGLF